MRFYAACQILVECFRCLAARESPEFRAPGQPQEEYPEAQENTKRVQPPGIEPGVPRWQRDMLPLHHGCCDGSEPKITQLKPRRLQNDDLQLFILSIHIHVLYTLSNYVWLMTSRYLLHRLQALATRERLALPCTQATPFVPSTPAERSRHQPQHHAVLTVSTWT